MLVKIDRITLGTIEKFCHFTQRTFGANSFLWERICITLKVICLLGISFPADHGWHRGVDVLLSVFGAIGFSLSFHRESLSQSQAEEKTSNALKASGHRERLIYLALTLLDGVLFIAGARFSPWFEFAALEAHFRAVDNLPLGPSRVRQLLNSLRGSLSPMPVTA